MLLRNKAGALRDVEQRQRDRYALLGCSPEKFPDVTDDSSAGEEVDVHDISFILQPDVPDLPEVINTPSNMYTVLGDEQVVPSPKAKRSTTFSSRIPVLKRPAAHHTRLRTLTRALISLHARHTLAGLVASAGMETPTTADLNTDSVSMQTILQSLCCNTVADARVSNEGTGFLRTFLRSFSRGLTRSQAVAAPSLAAARTRKHRAEESKTEPESLSPGQLDAQQTTLDQDAITLMRQVGPSLTRCQTTSFD